MASLEASEQLSRYWQEQITTWEQSGQSQKAFCEQHELNYHRFGYWRRKFIEQQNPENKSRNSFVAVRPIQNSTNSGLSLTLPNGVLIQGIEPHNLAVVRQLLQQL
jgi:hypothetical protein